MSLRAVWAEDLLVSVLEGEVKGLGREVPDDVGQVASPERLEPLFSVDSCEAISNTLVLLIFSNVPGGVLNLKQELDSLNWGNCSL